MWQLLYILAYTIQVVICGSNLIVNVKELREKLS